MMTFILFVLSFFFVLVVAMLVAALSVFVGAVLIKVVDYLLYKVDAFQRYN